MDKSIKAHTLAFMSHQEMRPDKWENLIEEKKPAEVLEFKPNDPDWKSRYSIRILQEF